MYQIQQALHTELDTGVPATATLATALGDGHPHDSLLSGTGPTGGYPWACGGNAAVKSFLTSAPAMKALHIEQPGRSAFSYHSSGPASITLHPELSKKASKSQMITSLPCFSMAPTIVIKDVVCIPAPYALGDGCKTRLISRICNKTV